MVTIAWDDRYRIGLPIIDNQHKYLLQLINKLYDDITSGALPNCLGEVFNNLDDYAVYHFTLEERWMQGQLYPEFTRHRQEHATFKEHIAELRRLYQRRDDAAALKTLTFLYHWLATHIQGSDFQFGQFIARTTDTSHDTMSAKAATEPSSPAVESTTLSPSFKRSTRLT